MPLKGRSSDTLVIPRYWQLDGLLSCIVCVCVPLVHTHGHPDRMINNGQVAFNITHTHDDNVFLCGQQCHQVEGWAFKTKCVFSKR